MSLDPNPNTQRYLDLLHSMLDIAHDVAKTIHRDATTEPEPNTPKPDYTIPLERVTRTIRRTILLALKVVEPPKPERSDPKPNRIAARKRILREVEDHITRNTDDEEETEALKADLLDRLDSEELEEEIDTRPVPEIIIDIVRDLGLDTNWGPNRFKRRTSEDVEALTARAAALLPAIRPPRTGPPAKHPRREPVPDNPAELRALALQLAGLRPR